MTKKVFFAGVVVIASAVFFMRGGGDEASTSDSDATHEATFNNQIWIDAIPVRETDKMNIFAALNEPQLGVFQSASQWEGDYTIFSWQDQGKGKVAIEMMQTGEKHKLKVSVSNKDCGNFDLCLTVKGSPRGPQTYYSMDDWVIDAAELEPGALAETARAFASSL